MSAPLTITIAGQNLELGAPQALLLLALAPVFFLVALRSLGDFSRRQLLLQAALRTLVLAAMAVALARPALRQDRREVSAVVLADVSDSISEGGLEGTRRIVDGILAESERRGFSLGGAAATVRVVRFARRPAEIVGERGARAANSVARFPAPHGAGTDLALAVALGQGLLDPDAIPRMLLVSDGEPTAGDLLAQADRAAARGVRIDVVPISDGDRTGDVAVDTLAAPDEVRPNAPFELEARLIADRAGVARVRLERDGVPIGAEAEREVRLAPGATAIRWTTRVEHPGATTFRARIVSAEHDLHRENNQGAVAVLAESAPRVLLVDGDLAAASPFARALEQEEIAVDVRGPRGLPGRPGLDRYDLIVLSDTPRAAVGDAALRALDGYVRDGGGLLVTGGPQSFGSGGWNDSPLEPLLPVRLDLPERRDEATLALALVIDKSGSMSGSKMELTKQAARATAEMLPPTDQIAIVVFDSQAFPVVRLQRAANRMRIFNDIGRIQASGGTNILAGLREAVDQLLAARARKKHVILLSDGQSPHEGIADVVDAAAAARITISAVGVGDGADRTLLEKIGTRGGGRFYHTRDPASIPRIFTRETAQMGRSSIVEEPTAVRVRKRAELLAGIAVETAPPLGGYTITRPRAQADLILSSGRGDPLLARWQLGLGQVTAWTSDVKPRWSTAWLRWPPFPKLWAQIARATMRRRAAMRLPMRASADGPNASVVIDAVGPDDRFLTGLEGALEVVANTSDADVPPPPARRRIPLSESAPGRYQTSFPIDPDRPATLFLRATLSRGTSPVADALGRIVVPFAPELRPWTAEGVPHGRALLAAVARRTGGAVLDAGTPSIGARLLDPGTNSRSARRPLRTPVLLVGLALFVLDVLVRRVRLRPP